MKQFLLGFIVSMVICLVVLNMINIPEYTIVKEVTCI